jgi:hypothetical protein
MAADEVKRRTDVALDAIKRAFGTGEDEFGATLFVNHHLEELPESYWQQHLGTSEPEPISVLKLLQLRSNWGENEIENFDFSLPDEVTNYIISVHFDDLGAVDGISMES